MYRYIPAVCTFNKTSCFQTHPERVRRDKIKVVQLLCIGYDVTKSNFETAQVYPESIHWHGTSTYPAFTCTYWYILVRTGTDVNQTAHFIGSQSGCPPAPMSLSRTLGLVLSHSHSFLPHGSLLHSQTIQAWLVTATVLQPSV